MGDLGVYAEATLIVEDDGQQSKGGESKEAGTQEEQTKQGLPPCNTYILSQLCFAGGLLFLLRNARKTADTVGQHKVRGGLSLLPVYMKLAWTALGRLRMILTLRQLGGLLADRHLRRLNIHTAGPASAEAAAGVSGVLLDCSVHL